MVTMAASTDMACSDEAGPRRSTPAAGRILIGTQQCQIALTVQDAKVNCGRAKRHVPIEFPHQLCQQVLPQQHPAVWSCLFAGDQVPKMLAAVDRWKAAVKLHSLDETASELASRCPPRSLKYVSHTLVVQNS